MDVLTGAGTGPAVTPSSPWLVRWRSLPDAGFRLFCLPHAGGGASAYRAWAQWLAPSVEVVAIRLPGRENRFREHPFTRVDDLVPMIVSQLEPMLDRPYAWFGHSMGAVIAFEVCRLARRLGLRGPERLLVSGRPAPHLSLRGPLVHDAPTARLLARLREMEGTPPEILDDPAVLATLLPAIRADFAVAETYRYRPAAPLDLPIFAYGGTDDPFATTGELHAWHRHTTAPCTVRMFGGGHFYLHEGRQQFLPVLSADLMLRQPPPWPPQPGREPGSNRHDLGDHS